MSLRENTRHTFRGFRLSAPQNFSRGWARTRSAVVARNCVMTRGISDISQRPEGMPSALGNANPRSTGVFRSVAQNIDASLPI
jgi:hypothetical protein